MILVIDNYDSFTYNLVQYLGELGQQLEVFRNDKIDVPTIERKNPDRIVISPGPGNPDQAGITLKVVKAFEGKKTDSGRLPGTPGDWAGFRGQGRARALPDARQDERDLPR